MTTVTTEQVQKDYQGVLSRLLEGETVAIEKDGEQVGLLEPIQRPRQVRLGVLSGRLAVPEGWKEIARGEIERDFYGAE